MKKILFTFLMFSVLSLSASSNALVLLVENDEPEKTDLYNTSNGDGVVPPYRIPGISVAPDGRIVTVAARLVCGTDPGYGQVDVVCRKSDDNGKTWTDKQEVAVGTGKTSKNENYFDSAFGDPAVVCDRTSDEVLIMAVAGCTVYSNANTTRQNPNLIAAIRSLDRGETWQEPENQTEMIYSLYDSGKVIQSAFIAGGRVFQSRIIKKDKYYRLYAAMCARPNGNRVIFSDDFGRTWQALGGATALPVPNGDEPKCEEMPDGRVIISSRMAAGRYYNIFSYSDTYAGEGKWSSNKQCQFPGAGLTPQGTATNGELLMVPVKRNKDNKNMYLVLQSLPAGSGRTNVTIYYKELSEYTDLNTVANFVKSWDGHYQVTDQASAYSSMDLQADDRIGFIYEETLTGWGKRNNPISTSFPNGEGQHNFDGYNNIYVAYPLEYITDGKYSIDRSMSRGAFLRDYFAVAVSKATKLDETQKTQAENYAANLSDDPTVEEIEKMYEYLAGEVPADPFDGKIVTLTNVQQDGKEFSLFIDNNILTFDAQPASAHGDAAKFKCNKQANEMYTFYNEEASCYMIWRAGKNYGYNDNAGTLATYEATYCDWSINDASGTRDNTYYLTSKRVDGTTDGTLIIMNSGVFDSWTTGVGYTANYSNLFRIDDVTPTVGITPTIAGVETSAIYDTQGRRVTQTSHGIFIQNGKKIVR